jgi:hypothetical protein
LKKGSRKKILSIQNNDTPSLDPEFPTARIKKGKHKFHSSKVNSKLLAYDKSLDKGEYLGKKLQTQQSKTKTREKFMLRLEPHHKAINSRLLRARSS